MVLESTVVLRLCGMFTRLVLNTCLFSGAAGNNKLSMTDDNRRTDRSNLFAFIDFVLDNSD